MCLRPPKAEVFNGLSVLQDSISGISPLVKPISETKKNYANIICRHSSTAAFPQKNKRVHC